MIVSKTRLQFIFFVLIFRVLLEISYIYYIAPYHSYIGLKYNLNIFKLFESYALMLILLFLIDVRPKRPSDIIVTSIFFCFLIVPTLSFFSMNDESRVFTYLSVLSFLVVLYIRKIPLYFKYQVFIKRSNYLGILIAFLFVMLTAAWMLINNGLSFFNLNLWSVYEYRGESTAAIGGGIMGYINLWTFKVFNITLIAWFLYKRSTIGVVLLLIVQLFFFGISNHKSVLFFPFLVFLIYWAFNKNQNNGSLKFLYVLLGSVIMAFIVDYILDISVATTLVTRRIFYVPTLMNFTYYNYFSNEGFVYLSNSIFSHFFTYPFADEPPYLIGDYLLGRPEANAGSGYLGTAYMHFGSIGMMVFSAIVGLLLGILDLFWRRKDQLWFPVCIVLIPFFSVILSADLAVTIVSHGLAVSFIILWSFRNIGRRSNEMIEVMKSYMGRKIKES